MTRNHRIHRITRFLAVLTALCLLLSAVPAAPAAAGEAWQEQALPYAAKLRAGVAFCADPELTEETGILQQDAVILVTEIRGNAARITYTVQKQNKQQAWVRGKYLILLSAATPTDLDPRILDDDVQLAAPAVPREEEEQPERPAEEEPAYEPAEEETEESPSEPFTDGETTEDEPISPDVIPSNVEESPTDSDSAPKQEDEEPASDDVIPTEVKDEAEESPSEPLSDDEPAEDEPASPAVIPTNAEESPTDSDFTPNQENESPAPVATPTDIREEEAPSASENEDEISEISFEEITAEPQSGENPGGNAVYTITEAGQLELADYENPEYVTEDLPDIRDQGNYDTCWAFAAIGGLEAFLTKQNNAGSSIDLSEFFLLYFSAHNFPNPKAGGKGDEITYNGDGSYLDNGGFSRLAYHILATLIGTTSEADNPYPDAGVDQPVNTSADIAAQITGAYNLDIKNTSLIKQQIIENGSVKVSVYMPKEENYNKIVNVGGGKAGFKSSTSSLYGTYAGTNHDVLLIGWNDEYGTENFMSDPRPSGKGAWKARNSWGSGWGISGEFWISYEDASLLSGQAVSFTAENDSDKMADYCYSYDKGLSSSAAVVDNQAVISQSFTVDGQEVLHSIGIETTEYTDKDSGKKVFAPMTLSAVVKNADGQVIASTGNVDANYSGFYLLNLKDPCVLNAASTVEVVVTCKTKQTGKVAVLYQKNKSTSKAGDIAMTASTASSGVIVNGTKLKDEDNVACDSTIKLYTKRNNSTGLVTGVSLNKTSLGLKTGENETLKATITPSNATNQSLRWYSSDTSIATVDENGKVVGKAKSGTAVITAVSSNGKSAACNVEVVYQNLPVTKVKISGFDSHTKRIDHSTDAGIKLGDKLTLTAVLTPEYTTQPGIEWKSSNPSVLTIEKTEGKTCTIRLNKNGSARITLQSTENTGLSDWVDFTVYLPVLVSAVKLEPSAAALWEGGNQQLTATVQPENAENKKIKWSSSNPAVATVNDMGVVTGVKDGTAVITAASEDGNASASCVVLVSTQDQIQAFVYRMYRVCLLREPDDIGFVYWIDKIRSGERSGAQAAFEFFFSNEMIARNLSDTDYVERAYESILGRASDAEGKAYWMQRLQAGFSRKALISGFISSNEFGAICARYGIERGSYALTEPRDQNYGITAYVSRLYTKMQGRVYDVGGLNYWCNIILKNPKKDTLVQVAVDGFMHSNEFKAKNLSDTEFVKVMYRTFLDREAEPAGLQYWLNKLASGMTRENVAAGFAASDEFGAIMARYGF